MAPRKIKIEAVGDYFAKKIAPTIRLKGLWLKQAGFNPGNYVEVTFPQNGEIRLLLKETPTGAPEKSEKPISRPGG